VSPGRGGRPDRARALRSVPTVSPQEGLHLRFTPPGAGNRSTRLDRQSVVDTLKSGGSKDHDVLHLQTQALHPRARQLQQLGIAAIAIGLLSSLAVLLSTLGIPLAISGLWTRLRASQSIATVAAGWSEDPGAAGAPRARVPWCRRRVDSKIEPPSAHRWRSDDERAGLGRARARALLARGNRRTGAPRARSRRRPAGPDDEPGLSGGDARVRARAARSAAHGPGGYAGAPMRGSISATTRSRSSAAGTPCCTPMR
jgi:hypothetical protein